MILAFLMVGLPIGGLIVLIGIDPIDRRWYNYRSREHLTSVLLAKGVRAMTEFDPVFNVFVHDGIILPCSHRERHENCVACSMAGEPIAEAHLMMRLKARYEAKRGSFSDYEECGEGS